MRKPKAKGDRGSWEPGTPVEQNACYWSDEPAVIPRTAKIPAGALTVVDLFCGCGGFSVGFELAGFHSLIGADIHPPSVATFARNHPTASMIVGDMRRVKDETIIEAAGGHRVDVVAAGVPCQGFSLNNRKRHDKDDRNFLFREFIRIMNLFSPSVVLLENVSGLASSANGAFKESICHAIEESGYRVDCEMLNALDYGVPQKRRRLFFLGVRPGVKLRWLKPTHGPGRANPIVTVWDAIGDLPQVGPGEMADQYDKDPFTDYQRFMRKSCRTELHNHEAPNHPSETIEKIGATIPGKPIYPKFPQRIRLNSDAPSPTQVSGGIRPQYQFGHPKSPRGLTIRERCRLQSFPDRYFICGGIVQGRVQTGNAVPPLLAKAVAHEIKAMLRGEPPSKDSVPPKKWSGRLDSNQRPLGPENGTDYQ